MQPVQSLWLHRLLHDYCVEHHTLAASAQVVLDGRVAEPEWLCNRNWQPTGSSESDVSAESLQGCNDVWSSTCTCEHISEASSDSDLEADETRPEIGLMLTQPQQLSVSV
jgi:hypothetical protein